MKQNTIAGLIATLLLLVVIASPAIYIFLTGDFPGASRFYGIEEDAQIVTDILTARHNIFGGIK